ncbi:MAG: site-specific DNA-methyltransferase [Eggerthellaceae bacterium]
MDSQIKQMDLESKDLVAERIEQMKVLFPEIATEGDGSIDFEKLRLILGDEVDEGDERYAFTWPGKADAIRQSQTVSTATLRPCPEESVGWDTTRNLYIEGDNLEVLKLLQRGYHGKVKMIYIDPPYNTGSQFVYPDSFGESIAHYRRMTNTTQESNSETDGKFHSRWCSMMYARLKLARELLGEDGAVFISIDDHELVNLTKIANEIFSERCFVGVLPRVTKKSGKDHSATIASNHDYVCIYAKNIEVLTLNGFEVNDGAYPQIDEYFDERGPYKVNQTLDYDSLWYNPKMDFPIVVDGITYYPGGDEELHIERHKGNHTPKDWVWRWSMAKFEFGYANGFVEIKAGRERPRIYTKTYRNASIAKDADGNYYVEHIDRSSKMSSIELTENIYSNDNAKKNLDAIGMGSDFDFSKPISLVMKLLELVRFDDGDIIMDFFSGSATTAVSMFEYNAAHKKHVRSILVQLPEPVESSQYATICEIGEERIRRAGEKIAAEVEESNRHLKLGEEPKKIPDIGFRVLKLDESGIAKPEPGQLMLDRIKPGRTDEDIIFEMMLKWGYELTYPIEKMKLGGGYPCYSVAADSLICCMSEGLTLQALHEIADLEPDRVLILDSILDDTLKLNALQIFKRAEERTQKTIDLRTV